MVDEIDWQKEDSIDVFDLATNGYTCCMKGIWMDVSTDVNSETITVRKLQFELDIIFILKPRKTIAGCWRQEGCEG